MNKTLIDSCDTLQLEPFAYPWAWDMSRECEDNTWTPEEIPVAPDVADYRGSDTDPVHKHIFEAVLAQLTTFDILRGDDTAETFLQIFQPQEIKHFLKRLIWEEALHTRSYRFIIENMSIPLEIYTRYNTVPAMKARVDYSNMVSRPLIEVAIAKMFEGVAHTPKQEELHAAGKVYILRGLVWWFLFFEGVWFWMNLAGPIQHLSRAFNRFNGAAEQFQYILRDEAQHVRFGVNLIRAYMLEHPETVETALPLIHTDALKCIELEQEFMKYVLEKGNLVGYSLHDHISTAKALVNQRLRSISLDNFFNPEEAKHMFPWFSEVVELKKEKNFFETRVTDYRKANLEFDETQDNDYNPFASPIEPE